MSRRLSWLNNPYLGMFTVILGLIGVSNWPERTPGADRGVWEEARDGQPDELSEFLSKEGWMDPPLPGEASRLRKFSDRKGSQREFWIQSPHHPNKS